VLDLFAGTGALGLEALSRGADHVTFVDDGRKAGQLVRANIKLLGVGGQTTVLGTNATRLPAATIPATLVFLDPPYGKSLGEKALASARDVGWIAPEALIVWEESAPMDAPDGFEFLEHRKYGDTHVTLLEAV
jgi:16S rRNA (guanine966-N2)-methyltransferase